MQGLESTRPPCRTTRNLTASPPPLFPSYPTLASTPRLYYSPLQLTNTKFKEASWDWVQNTATATSKWGGIEDWDVSIVTNMDRSFSSSRNEAGGQAASGNLQAKVWTSRADLRKWDTSQVTSMQRLFYQAKKFNGDVSTWDVARVITFQQVFDECSHFNGDVSSKDNPPNAMFTLYTIHSCTFIHFSYFFFEQLTNPIFSILVLPFVPLWPLSYRCQHGAWAKERTSMRCLRKQKPFSAPAWIRGMLRRERG